MRVQNVAFSTIKTLTEPFEVRSGIRSGDVLGEAFEHHQASGIKWTMTSFLQHLDQADDICLFAHNIPKLCAMVKSLEVVAAFASLTINCLKLKFFGFIIYLMRSFYR